MEDLEVNGRYAPSSHRVFRLRKDTTSRRRNREGHGAQVLELRAPQPDE